MATIIEQQYALNSVVFDVNYATGSIRDLSPNNAAASVTAPAQWSNTKYGYGVRLYDIGYISYADNSSNRLTGSDATFIFFGKFCELQTSSRLICKRNAGGTSYDISCGILSSQKRWGIWDGTSTGIMNVPSFGESMIVFTLVSGQKAKIYIDGTYISEANVANTIPNSSAPLIVGNYYNTASKTPLNSPLCRVLLLNKVLSSEEIAQLHTELVHQKYPLRAYSFGKRLAPIEDPPGCPSLLKTDFTTRLPDGRLADLSGNGWHGTVYQAAQEGNALNVLGGKTYGSYVSFGNVTAINALTKLTMMMHVNLSATANAPLCIRGASTVSVTGMNLAAAGTDLQVRLGNGINTFATVPAPPKGTPVLITAAFDGDGAGNEGKVKAYVDGTPQALTFVGTIPSQLATNAASNLEIGRFNYATAAGDALLKPGFFAIYPAALTPEQVEYVRKQIARRQTFELDMQKVPVSLANMVGPFDIPNTPFRLQSGGTWKISEDSNGKRWFERVSGANFSNYMPSKQVYGTWIFDIYHANSEWVLPISNTEDPVSTSRNSYVFIMNANDIGFYLLSPSSGSSALFTSLGTISVGINYKIAITRSSDGSFTCYIKGGTYTNWSIISASAGTNPVINNNYKTSSYFLFSTASSGGASKFSNPRFYQGVLTADDLNQMGL